MFFTVQQFTGVAGQTFNYIYYTFSPDVKSYFIIFLVVGTIGCLSFCFLPKVNDITEEEIAPETKSPSSENETLNDLAEQPNSELGKSLESEKVVSKKEIEPKPQSGVKKSI